MPCYDCCAGLAKRGGVEVLPEGLMPLFLLGLDKRLMVCYTQNVIKIKRERKKLWLKKIKLKPTVI